jgi:copper chaperone CopZ
LTKAGHSAMIILGIKVDPLKSPPDFKMIEKGMERLRGITSFEVNYVSGTVKVHYNPDLLTAKRIREKLEELEKRPTRK